jgi:hypothetical protein
VHRIIGNGKNDGIVAVAALAALAATELPGATITLT